MVQTTHTSATYTCTPMLLASQFTGVPVRSQSSSLANYIGEGAGAMPWSILREKSRPICTDIQHLDVWLEGTLGASQLMSITR